MKVEIAHDRLAKQVYSKADASDKARRAAYQLLRRELERHTKNKRVLLGREDLQEIAPHLSTLNLDAPETNFIRRSKAALRLNLFIGIGIGIIVLLAALASLYLINQEKNRAEAAALRAQSIALAGKAREMQARQLHGKSLRFAQHAAEVEYNEETSKALYDTYFAEQNWYPTARYDSLPPWSYRQFQISQSNPIRLMIYSPSSTEKLIIMDEDLNKLAHYPDDVSTPSLSADGKTLFYIKGYTANWQSLEDIDQLISRPIDKRPHQVWLSPDGSETTLVYTDFERDSEPHTISRIFRDKDGVQAIDWANSRVAATYSPDGRYLFLHFDNWLRAWDQSGEQVATVSAPTVSTQQLYTLNSAYNTDDSHDYQLMLVWNQRSKTKASLWSLNNRKMEWQMGNDVLSTPLAMVTDYGRNGHGLFVYYANNQVQRNWKVSELFEDVLFNPEGSRIRNIKHHPYLDVLFIIDDAGQIIRFDKLDKAREEKLFVNQFNWTVEDQFAQGRLLIVKEMPVSYSENSKKPFKLMPSDSALVLHAFDEMPYRLSAPEQGIHALAVTGRKFRPLSISEDGDRMIDRNLMVVDDEGQVIWRKSWAMAARHTGLFALHPTRPLIAYEDGQGIAVENIYSGPRYRVDRRAINRQQLYGLAFGNEQGDELIWLDEDANYDRHILRLDSTNKVIATGQPERYLNIFPTLQLHPDGKHLLLAGSDGISLYDEQLMSWRRINAADESMTGYGILSNNLMVMNVGRQGQFLYKLTTTDQPERLLTLPESEVLASVSSDKRYLMLTHGQSRSIYPFSSDRILAAIQSSNLLPLSAEEQQRYEIHTNPVLYPMEW